MGQEVIDSHNNQPHIVWFIDASGDIPPIPPSHFIAVEVWSVGVSRVLYI